MRFFTKEVRIALVAILGIVVLFFGLHFLKGMPVFSNDDVYYVTFDNIDGLTVSNSVFADGYQVGNVKAIDYNYQKSGKVVVALEVDNELRIPKGSTAEIDKDLMGNIQLNLLMANNPRERFEPGDTLKGVNAAGLMGAVQQLMPKVEQMLPKVDSILTSVNLLLADPSIARSLHNIETISANLATSTQGLNQLVAEVNGQVPGMMHKADYALDKAGHRPVERQERNRRSAHQRPGALQQHDGYDAVGRLPAHRPQGPSKALRSLLALRQEGQINNIEASEKFHFFNSDAFFMAKQMNKNKLGAAA